MEESHFGIISLPSQWTHELVCGLIYKRFLSPCPQSQQQPTDRWHCDVESLNQRDCVFPEFLWCVFITTVTSHLLTACHNRQSHALHMHDTEDLLALQCLTYRCGLCVVLSGCYTCVGGILKYGL